MCSQAGTLGSSGNCGIHLRFLPPSNLYYSPAPTVTETRIHESCGHHADEVRANPGGFSGSPNTCCGDPSSGYIYHDEQWNTHAWHNGDHTITATVTYSTNASGYPPTITQYAISKSITVTVQNLIVTSTQPANPDPILWDPASVTTTIKANVSAAYKAVQPIKLKIYTSSQTLVKELTQNAAVGNETTEVRFIWDGSQTGTSDIAPKGVYLFNWEVGPWDYGPDLDTDKSEFMVFGNPATTLAVIAGDSGGQVVTFGRTLTDVYSTAATSCIVRVYERWTLSCRATATMPTDLGYSTVTFRVPPPTPFNVDDVGAGVAEWDYLCVPIDADSAHDKGHRNRAVLQNNNRKPPRILLTYGGAYPRDLESGVGALNTESMADAANDVAGRGGYNLWQVRRDRFVGSNNGARISPDQILYAPYTLGATNCPQGLMRQMVDVAIFCGHGLANGSPRNGTAFKFGTRQDPGYDDTGQFAVCADAAAYQFYAGLTPAWDGEWEADTAGPLWNLVVHTSTPVQLVVWWGCNTTSSWEGAGLPASTCNSLGASYSVGFRTEWSGIQGKTFFHEFAKERMWDGDPHGATDGTVYQGVHHGVVAAQRIKEIGSHDIKWRGYCGLTSNGVNRERYRLLR